MREVFIEVFVGNPLVGAEQGLPSRDTLSRTNAVVRVFGVNAGDHASDDVALALDGPSDSDLAGTDAASPAATAALVLVLILRQSADESLIDFHNAHELVEIFASPIRHGIRLHMYSAVE